MTQGIRERKGTLDGNSVFLARWREQPYARIYREIQPDRIDIPGSGGKIEGDPTIRSWIIDDWSGGWGSPLWDEQTSGFNVAAGLRPGYDNKGLILTPKVDNPQTDAPATMAASRMFTRGYVSLYTADATTEDGYVWDDSNEQWDVKTGLSGVGGPSTFYSMAYLDDFVYLATGSEIHKWAPGSAATVHHNAFSLHPRLASFRGVLYAADNVGDLYTIDTSTTNTRTKVVDNPGHSLFQSDNGITVDDTGIQWLVRTDGGFLEVHHYNHWTDTHSVLGRLGDFAFNNNSAIYYAKGFTWVLTSNTNALNDGGYLWFKGGGQQGVITIPAGSNDQSVSYSIAGVIGDDLYFFLNGVLWVYNFDGGLYRVTKGDSDGLDHIQGIAFKNQIFAGGDTVSKGASTRYHLDQLDTSTASYSTLDTGRFDFDYPGFNKIFTEVIVYTDEGDGWDGNLQLSYSVDGGTFTAHADTKTISSANRKHTFVLSDSSTTVSGTELELQLRMKSDGTDAPIIRKVVARAMPAENIEEIVLELDVSNPTAEGESPRSTDLLSNLRTLAAAGDVFQFVNPWEYEETESSETLAVKLVELVLPHEGPEARDEGVARVRLRVV
jgi:hypothetical protein